jgi:hypothetical protein
MNKKRKKKSLIKKVGNVLLFIVKIPYFIIRWVYNCTKKISKKNKEIRVKKERKAILPEFLEMNILKTFSGNYNKWIRKFYSSDSQIGIILGARGTGKTAIGIKMLENFYAKTNKKCFAMGFKKENLPLWIKSIENISEIQNNSLVLIDEGGIMFNSRSSMSNANKVLSQLILISRHKNISILFISQNSSNLEVNILRQADFLILKKSSLLQKDFERKIIQKIYSETKDGFDKYKNEIGITYIYSEEFRGFLSNSLPSFWKENLSKGFK